MENVLKGSRFKLIPGKTSHVAVSKVYFENLNAIRFMAAFLVIIHHVEQFKTILNYPSEGGAVTGIIGKLGVVLFFVLSGFLISFLLFKEKAVTQTISIKSFYIRRILRIWPLYFLVILTALFVLPFFDFFTLPGLDSTAVWNDLLLKSALFIFFLPNLVLAGFGMIPYASQTWSIGAEEQFYLIWPVLNKWFKNKWVLMGGVILFYMAIKLSGLYLLPKTEAVKIFNQYWEMTPIDCMAIGGLFALIAHEKNQLTDKIKKIIFKKWFQWCILGITVGLISNGFYMLYHLHYEFYALLFGVLICNFACNPKRIFSMEFGWLNYLGKISYGLYMYHTIAIVACIKILAHFDLLINPILYPLSLLVVIAISTVSYEFFEKRFIQRKHKYSKILSGENAR